jgi:site-specific recombinase XerD
MTLYEAIDSYIRIRRSLGAVFTSDARILRSFGRALDDIPVIEIEPQAVHEFCRGAGPPTRWWERKHQALQGFFDFLVTRGHLADSPLSERRPHVVGSFEPYVYSRDELQRLLDATTILEGSRSPLQHLTFRVLLLTLYGAGLRPSEGLRLRCCDVDLNERVLSIWDTKFFKSRLVPIGASLVARLATYRQAREHLPMPAADRSAFFVSRKGTAITLDKLEKVFVRLREHAEVRRPADARWQPRLHDLRHAFAVHRLVTWYREGVDVQAHLPLLSTYLGHVNVSGTKAYLTMTPELLAEASKRFEQYAVGEEGHHDV